MAKSNGGLNDPARQPAHEFLELFGSGEGSPNSSDPSDASDVSRDRPVAQPIRQPQAPEPLPQSGDGSDNGDEPHSGFPEAPEAMVLDLSRSRNAEVQYQRIYTRLAARSAGSKSIKTIMFVGSDHGDGVTTTATFFARMMAKSRKVLLVDANLRTPALGDLFRLRRNGGGGLADFLVRKVSLDGVITETEVPNLFVMTCGSAPLAPPYLFENGTFADLLEKLRDKFDYIIFDAAPMKSYLDAVFLATQVDGVILIVKAEATPIEVGLDIKKRLEEVNAPIIGVVVNRTKDYVPGFLRKRLS